MLIKILKILGWLVLILFILSFVIALIFGFPIRQTLRVVFGAIYVLFVPGFVWSYVFFKKRTDIHKDVINTPMKDEVTVAVGDSHRSVTVTENPLDLIERITLSVALSMAMGPLLIFFLNKIGVKINFLNSFLELLVLIIGGLIVIFVQETRKLKKSNAKI